MDIRTALRAVREDMRSKRMQRLVDGLIEETEAGSPLWKSLQSTHLMPPHVVSLVRLGEESGRLSENFNVIVQQQAKDRLFRSKIFSAMMYPAMVLTLTGIIGIGIAWFILPRLATLFDELDIALPGLTRALIFVGKAFGDYGAWLVPASIGLLGAFFYLLFVSKKTKIVGQALLFSTPGVSRLLQEVELARAGFVFGTLLQAGMPIVQVAESLRDATTLERYRRLYHFFAEHLEVGDSFRKIFAFYPKLRKLIPLPIQQLISAAEQSGRLSDTFLAIGATYEARTETTMKNVSVVLEPLLLVIVWLGVVAVALAIILPIYSLIGGFHTT